MGKYTKIKADGGPIKKVRISDKGVVKDVPINTKEYKQYYDSKTLAKASEDPNLLIAAQDLNPVEVKAEKPTWLTFKEEAIKNYPESKFRSEYFLPALRPSDLDSLPQNALDEYNKRINNTVAQRLLKERNLDKNWDAKTQVEAFTPYERDIILNSDYGKDLARNVRLYDSELANKESFSNSNNKADLLRRQTQATGDKLSLQNLPYVGQYIPNILDVTGGIGNMASNLGAAPDNWNRGNYLSAIGAVAAPIGVGRLASVGAPTTAQFVNNVVNPLAGTGSLIKGAGKYLTTQTPLKNVYKLNPKAYHYNLPENTMWRGLGQEGMEDAVSSGVFRSKQDVVPEYFPGSKLRINKEFGTNPYFTPKFKTAATYGDQFIAEVPRDAANWTNRYGRGKTWSQIADKPIPISEGKILKKDWLKGYKEYTPPVNSVSSKGTTGSITSLTQSDEPLKILTGNHFKSDIPKNNRYISQGDINTMAAREKNWLTSDEYIKRRSAATGESVDQIKKDVDQIFKSWDKTKVAAKKLSDNTHGLYKASDYKILLNEDLSRKQAIRTLAHEGVHAFSPLAGNNSMRGFRNYPSVDIGNVLTNIKNYSHNNYLRLPEEQQVRGLGILDFIENKYGIPRGTKLSMDDVDRFADDINPGGIHHDEFWDKSNNDLGDLLDGMVQADKKLKFIPKNLTDKKFPFKLQHQGNVRKNLLEFLNKVYVIPGVGVGAGLLQQENKYGGYINNDMNTNYAMGGMIKRKDGSYSKRGLWDNIRANKGSGKKPTKEMLEQEAKIKAEYMYGGEMPEEYGKGGYIVTRSKDRKGKTHKVTGPDGTVKYFGDSKLGQHPNDPARKKAFYARHAKNLKGNPHFRAFARKTWADGGYMDNPPNDMPLNLPLKEQNPYLVPEYNQPMANGYILPDINRPRLLPEVNASEYKASYDTGTPDEIQIPTIVGGQYIGNNALERYRNTGEKFKTMKDPTSYSKYYDEYDKLHPKAMAIGGRMNQAQMLNAGKMRTGSEQGNSFGDYAADYGNFLLDGVTGIAEGLTGAEIYNPTYNTKLGKIAGAVNNQSGKMMGKIAPMALNMVAPGVGTAVGIAGKAVGTGLNASKNEEANGQLNLGNSMLPNMLGNNMEGIAQMETMGAAMQFKQGGLMHINEGGTHEQNALGGVPIGPNALVEQGETINNDFVFSDRLKPKGSKKTYAQLSKSVDTKYRLRPDDKLSKEAKQMDLDRLAAQQEAQKDEMSTKYMQKAMACGGKIMSNGGSFMGPISQSMNVTNGQNTLLANGGLMSNFMEPEPTYFNPAVLSNQYGEGGKIHIKPENRGKFTASANRAGMGVQEFAGHVLANKEDYSSTQVKRANFARNASKWKHAMGGNMYGNGGGPIFDPTMDITRQPDIFDENLNPVYLPNSYVNEEDNIMDSYYNSPDSKGLAVEGPNMENGQFVTNYPRLQGVQVNSYLPKLTTSNTTPLNIPQRIQRGNLNNVPQELNVQPYNFDEATQANQIQKTVNTQNPYPEVGNTGYLTNLAGNLVKAGMVATSKPPIYNPSVKFGRMNANPAERLAMQEGRREIQGTKDIIRNNATSSGQYLTNASLMGSSAANKLAGTIGGIRQGYDQQNVGIGNQEAQLNQQITAGNNLAKETFRDNRLNQYNKILDSVIGANQQRFATDEHANNYQNQVVEFLKTKGFRIGYKDGKLQMLDANNNVVNTEK